MRLRFILGLVILAVALQFIGKTLRGVLPMVQEAAQYPAGKQAFQLPPKRPPERMAAKEPSALTKAARKLKESFKTIKPVKLVNPTDLQEQKTGDSGRAFMQITLEDVRPPVHNKHLGAEASARLDAFLSEKRAKNVKLTNETGTLFGEQAKREVIYILAEDEKASRENARTSKTAQEYAQRQEKTDEQISARLAAVFEKYKKQFNRRLNENSSAWKEFFKRVNDFQKSAD